MTLRRAYVRTSGMGTPRLAGQLVVWGALVTACGASAPTAKAPSLLGAGDAGGREPPADAKGQLASLSAPSGPAASSEVTGDAKAAYDRGFQAWTTGDLPAAKAAFGEAVSKAPKAAGPRYSLGCVLERLGETQPAIDAYRAAYSDNGKYENAMGAYALLLARTGKGSDAAQFLSDQVAKLPDSTAPVTYLAEVKSIEGDSAGCQQLAQQVLAKKPDSKEAMVVIARDYYRNHRWDLARYALQAILEGADDNSIPPRDRGNPEALLLRGLIERETGQRKQALSDFEQAAAKRPDLFEAYINLGDMKLEAGNAIEAQTPLETAVRFAPTVALAHLDLGDCYRLLGRAADAKKELATALNIDSTLAGAHYDLGLLYLFAPSVPGATGQDDQLSKAIQELEAYKSMRGAKATKGPGDDVDELLSTAKRKQSELQLKTQAAAAAAAPPPAADGASAAPQSPDAGGQK